MPIWVGWIVTAVMNWLAKYFATHIAAYKRDMAAKKAAEAQAAQDNAKADKITEGSTSDEVDQAIDDSLKHT